MRLHSRWFFHHLRVRYQETDQMGVVYHANYLNWFEIGRTESIRTLGYDYRDVEARGLLLPVTELATQFKQPAKYDDWVTVFTRIAELTSLQLHFESQVRRLSADELARLPEAGLEGDEPPGQLLVSGMTKHVWLNRAWKPTRIDREAPDLFELLQHAIGRS
ncbi:MULTISPECIES: thioesterase family protein [unclassified Paenibacillus]|uniref:acyl-CoA thioesterase n=1 Tax=unclassified Paenibacillus TaxID=185978 RepID=UPI001C11BDFC|nr:MULTISPECIES: thioesterase family protein [unclassified Paenibacillus]MBU5441584.1 acyl-CoA thioesterase [Paenibacillus sp. MSJ-34]CAH0117746.1 1,4-dihydroxy-2-naphthoyl-CoA hydrolase [Paenibacillus sp. CECT 9249]